MNEHCQNYRELYGEPDMPPTLAQHAAHCEDCRAFARKQDALSEILPAWQAPGPSPDFALSVMGRIAESQRAPQTVGEWVKRFFSIQLTVPLPAAVFASILLLISLPLNAVYMTSQPNTNSFPGGQIAKAPGDGAVNVADPIKPTIPAGNMIQVGLDNTNFKGLSLPPNAFGAGAFLLIPIFDPIVPLSQSQQSVSTDVSEI